MTEFATKLLSQTHALRSKLGAVLVKVVKGFWWQPVALLAAASYWFYVANGIPTPNARTVEKYGVYGDSFGQLTSLFTALGFGGLIITLLLQQRQIRMQEDAARNAREKEEKGRYEEIFFRLLEVYRQTLSEVRVGDACGREVLRQAMDRIDTAIVEERVNDLPRDVQGRRDAGVLNDTDRQRIDYLHFRNFKIVGAEIHPQARLIDTLEVLLEHVVNGASDSRLIKTYKDLLWAQFTFIECRYFFFVALSRTNRARLRDLLAKADFFDRISRSQTHWLHREMYKEYWGLDIEQRELPPSIPMSQGKIKRAMRAHRAAGGEPKSAYTVVGVRKSNKG
ncbi:hypothetical protein [Pseudoduganella sp. OTU4001]|uniref:hypothetical protein n=1 Tax=Pseudoduganella sp. OTU4001 TaxID=3043854 RepID=UPI00313AF3A8